VRPLIEAILRHPLFYEGPRMVIPPAVYTAGLLRALGQTIETDAWTWIDTEAGQRLFMPPGLRGQRLRADDRLERHIVSVARGPVTGRHVGTRVLGEPNWGPHLLDANIALGNLIALVRSEAAAYVRRGGV